MVNIDDQARPHQSVGDRSAGERSLARADDESGPPRRLTAGQAAGRLGVKPETLYAYVSRGRLSRTLATDGRTSLFDAAEVDRLATRARPRGPATARALDLPVATSITTIVDGQLRYRGADASTLAGAATFEQVAVLLWTGAMPRESVVWTSTDAARVAARRAVAALAPGATAFDVLAAATAAAASTEPLRVDLARASVVRSGGLLLATLAEVLGNTPPRAPSPAVARADIATRLWPRLSPLPPSGARVTLLRAALVLLADHELATSTLAARIAASTRADPFAVVAAGLATASGPYHGSASERVHHLLLDAREQGVASALAGLHRTGAAYAGFGHPVYTVADPRAVHLLALLEPVIGRRAWTLVRGVADEVTDRSGLLPNIDFAIAAIAVSTGMAPSAGAFLFGFARIAGWIAHALEEYEERPLRYRPRAVYEDVSIGGRRRS